MQDAEVPPPKVQVATGARAKVARSSLSQSPLAKPKQLIHGLAAEVQNYLYYPDPQPLYVVIGTVVANMMRGYPVWMMLIGSPSSGRTQLLDILVDLPRVHLADNITGVSALLSGTSNKERAEDATGGLLNQIGGRGLILMEDFTNVLSMAHEPMKEVIGAFRRIFDGRWTRQVGSDGGKNLSWGIPNKGRLGFLGACTQKIDAHHSMIQELGQRWLYYRFPYSDGVGESMAALRNRNMERMDRELRDLVTGFFNALDLDWDSLGSRELKQRETDRLIAMAGLITTVRTTVGRDYKTKEINDVAMPEGPARMAQCLGQLYLGLEHAGLDESERWSVVMKTAMDSAPQMRVRVIEMIAGSESGGVSNQDIRDKLGCGKNTIETIIGGNGKGDLEVLRVVERVDGQVRLTADAKRLLWRGWRVGSRHGQEEQRIHLPKPKGGG